MRRARAAAVNVIPTTTGAAKALGLVLPTVVGKIKASCIRVPVPTGSLIELFVNLNAETSIAAVNAKFEQAAQTNLKGIVAYSEAPLVSKDIVGNPHSAIFDSLLTTVHNKMLKVTAWYDNEAGYSARLADMAMTL